MILRGNAHISKNLLLGATLSIKIFHEYGPRARMYKTSQKRSYE